jgi:ribosomal protein S18 acetylase RimI-like enzyme
MLIKRVRLRSLADAPYAFGLRSLEEEAALPDSHWHRLAAQVGGQALEWRDRCVSYVVLDGDDACGTATCYLCPRVPGRAYFTAAWIDPRYRRRGLGRHLVEEAVAWSGLHGADHLKLWVDDTNPAAAAFYRALGFIPTGESQPVSEGSSERQGSFERRLVAG